MLPSKSAANSAANSPKHQLPPPGHHSCALVHEESAAESAGAEVPWPQFEPHDVRETLARLGVPVPRQRWFDEGGQRYNSADFEPRGMPPYLLVFDLIFAALFRLTATTIRSDGLDGVYAFFLLFLPFAWIWASIVRVLNACDPEDASFEVYLLAVACLVMYLVYRFDLCFTSKDFEPGDTLYHECVDVVIAHTLLRFVVTALHVYTGYFVATLRTHAAGSVTSFVASIPLVVGMGVLLRRPHDGDSVLKLEVLIFCTLLLEVPFFFIVGFVRRKPAVWQRLLAIARWLSCCATGSNQAVVPRVPLSIPYFEARYERLTIIAIGSILANAVVGIPVSSRENLSNGEAFGCARRESETLSWPQEIRRVAPRCRYWVGVPWQAFLIKVYYFDLSPHHGSDKDRHAMRVSRLRGAAWLWLHLPVIGCIFWIAEQLYYSLGQREEDVFCADGDASLCIGYSYAWVGFLLSVTAVQALHTGQGHGHKKMGKTRRLSLRLLVAALVAALGHIAYRFEEFSAIAYFWLVIGTMTVQVVRRRPSSAATPRLTFVLAAQALVELWGRGFAMRPLPHPRESHNSQDVRDAPLRPHTSSARPSPFDLAAHAALASSDDR